MLKKKTQFRIACISDVHSFFRDIKIPHKCDLIVFAGDISMRGEIGVIAGFNEWITSLKIPTIAVAGNHDLTLDNNNYTAKAILNGMTYLENQSCTFEGLKVYGSPLSPKLSGWAFGYNRSKEKEVWSRIPDDTDILITHAPPLDIMDRVFYNRKNVGCIALRDRVREVKPTLHVFGHIHEARGVFKKDGTTYVNASICNYPKYEDLREPIVVNITKRERKEYKQIATDDIKNSTVTRES